ncbi:hypothetical protein [Vreelandella hamiltonii]|uniref:DUF4440 domain-containing protein n=1 Tax=Halomonas johnsoniae TaxID=502832 RepID=A0ABQ2WL69_9GAMM|nr:hypothetical protein [Halomonas johnsoniae]GGW62121.1 hypothetical protein GCM10007158_23900 [Halomonas johnsoniae]
MANNFEYRYSAYIHTREVAWSLRVNDIFVRDNHRVAYADYSPNIGMNLQQGENTLSLLFSPITEQDPETGEYLYALHDGVEIDIAVGRNQWTTQERERIHLVRMRFNEEEGKFEHLDTTAGEEERVAHQAHLRTDAHPQLSEIDNIIFGGGWTADGYRLDITFTVDDPIPPFHWESDAVVLEDSPELRRELREAYRHLHGLIERDNTEAIFEELEPVWARTAYMLTTHDSARQFIDDTRHGLSGYERVGAEGEVLQPLFWSDAPQDDQVEFLAEGRLVRIQPTPILWEHPPSGSERYASFPVVFYKSRDGQWRVADVLTGI